MSCHVSSNTDRAVYLVFLDERERESWDIESLSGHMYITFEIDAIWSPTRDVSGDYPRWNLKKMVADFLSESLNWCCA